MPEKLKRRNQLALEWDKVQEELRQLRESKERSDMLLDQASEKIRELTEERETALKKLNAQVAANVSMMDSLHQIAEVIRIHQENMKFLGVGKE